jgi:hypothetical protein
MTSLFVRGSKTGMVRLLKVFHAACGPLEDLSVVIHDSANVGAGSALAVVAWISGGPVKVVKHAEVVADLMGKDLQWSL